MGRKADIPASEVFLSPTNRRSHNGQGRAEDDPERASRVVGVASKKESQLLQRIASARSI
jgi:hypothetical protein